MTTPLTPEEIEKLINPEPASTTAIVYLRDGTSRKIEGSNPPSNIVGGYVGTKGQPRRYIAGDPEIIAYRIL